MGALLAWPLSYVGDGEGFGQVLSRLAFYLLVLIVPGTILAAALGARTTQGARGPAARAGTAIGAIFGWVTFFALAWFSAVFGFARRDQAFRDGIFGELGGVSLFLFPPLALASTALVLYALFAVGADGARRRRAILIAAALALLAGGLEALADPDLVGVLGALVSTAAGAAGGWVCGIGYARAGADRRLRRPPDKG